MTQTGPIRAIQQPSKQPNGHPVHCNALENRRYPELPKLRISGNGGDMFFVSRTRLSPKNGGYIAVADYKIAGNRSWWIPEGPPCNSVNTNKMDENWFANQLIGSVGSGMQAVSRETLFS